MAEAQKAYLVSTRHMMLDYVVAIADHIGKPTDSLTAHVCSVADHVRPVLDGITPLTCQVLKETRECIRMLDDPDNGYLIPADLRALHAEVARYVGLVKPGTPVMSAEWVLLRDMVQSSGYSVKPVSQLCSDAGDTWVCCRTDVIIYGFESEAEAWLGAIAAHMGKLSVHADALATAHFAHYPATPPKPEELDGLIKEARRQTREALEAYVAYSQPKTAQG